MGTTWLAPPPPDRDAVLAWVTDHLGDLVDGPVTASPRFRGGQVAADAALATLDVTGYAAARNEVWPPERRGATALSPWIRHGLLPLPLVWDAVADAPPRDRSRFRDELLWQEYARHLYARVGTATREGLRRTLVGASAGDDDLDGGSGWDRSLACLDLTVGELETDGYLVNQTRMWLASHWSHRAGLDWRDGEDRFYRHLLDGSRAANRAGWQWTAGTATGRPYAFTRRQVRRRAPGLCDTCALRDACPIEDLPPEPVLGPAEEHPRLRRDPDPEATAGPTHPTRRHGRGSPDGGVPAHPDAVWLTAESLGDTDPALTAHPDLPVVFVFDAPLLAGLRLSGKRLVFLTEALADLAERRDVEVAVEDPRAALRDQRLAVTAAPVPGFVRRADDLDVVVRHPWPWLVAPHGGSVASFSAWRRHARPRGG
jgi:deoxyribodipyrimidine photo-lyase